MEIKEFNSKHKAIKMPEGKAGEYAKYSCNFYNGCSNGCTYCYLKKGVLAHTMGGDKPTLKKCFKDEEHALEIFEKELKANLPELQKHGLFFTFTSDPFLPAPKVLTDEAVLLAVKNGIPVKLLTKNANVVGYAFDSCFKNYKKLIAIGFTLTGHDELEPNASTNAERIETIRKCHEVGFKTWISIEPVIDFDSSIKMIEATQYFCDLYKVGLESGKKYDKKSLQLFIGYIYTSNEWNGTEFKIYFKDSLLKVAGINREDLPANCVGRDYNIFENKQFGSAH
ncbi:hypothetical protein FACS189434_06620 [Bacteroidia bacterium]|nr:hypothetical protein FACS189434_06620 [Bacteroidia bacterium]